MSVVFAGRHSGQMPKRKSTWGSSGDLVSMLNRSEHKDGRPAFRASFAGLRSSLNVLSEVKEVVTPAQSPTTGAFDRIEMHEVAPAGKRNGEKEVAFREPDDNEPDSETPGFREEDAFSIAPSTVTTILSVQSEGFSPFAVSEGEGQSPGQDYQSQTSRF